MTRKKESISIYKRMTFQTHTAQLNACLINDLQYGGHEDRAAHEGEDENAGEPLLPDAQELGLFPRCRAAGLLLQAVDV